VEDLLVGPEQVEGGEDDAQGGDHRPPTVGEEGAERIRNSLTKPFNPGRPIEASIETVKMAARTGAGRCRPRSSFTCQVWRRS